MKSLSLTAITRRRRPPARPAYTAVIANRGLTAAGPFEVELRDGTATPLPATVAWVGAQVDVRASGSSAPACTAGTTLTVTVDPTHSIDESDFANNALTMTCPAVVVGR